jgi:hypothetical protein
VDATVNPADVLQFPEQVVLASQGTASLLCLQTKYVPEVIDTDGATVTFDMSKSDAHAVTLGGNRTLAVTNMTVGQELTLRLIQDSSGSRTVTWFTTIKWKGAAAPTLTTTAAHYDRIKIRQLDSAPTYEATADLNYA